jgi:hypothetical protein
VLGLAAAAGLYAHRVGDINLRLARACLEKDHAIAFSLVDPSEVGHAEVVRVSIQSGAEFDGSCKFGDHVAAEIE